MKKIVYLMGAIGLLSLQAAIPTAPKEIEPTVMQPQTDKELAWVDEQIEAILPARVGVSEVWINALRDPMKLLKPAPLPKSGGALLPPPKLGTASGPGMVLPPQIVEEPLRLMALMNKSALISGKWYKAGENVRSYTISEIRPGSVLLSGKKGQKLILFLTKQNTKIKITTK